MNRLHALDGLRGVLACLVMATHVGAVLAPGPILLLSQIPVGIFFVMSGLVLTRAWDGRFGVFLARRFIRLWPVYAVTLGAGYLLAWRHPIWAEFVFVPYPRFDGPEINGPIWSLFIEAWAAFFMPLIAWAGRAGRLQAMALGAAFMLGGQLYPPLLFGALFTIGAYMARFDFTNAWLSGRVPQFLGRVSYSLYLSHWLVINAVVMVVGLWGALLAVPVAFGVAWLLERWLERPSILLSRRLAGQNPTSASPALSSPALSLPGASSLESIARPAAKGAPEAQAPL